MDLRKLILDGGSFFPIMTSTVNYHQRSEPDITEAELTRLTAGGEESERP